MLVLMEERFQTWRQKTAIKFPRAVQGFQEKTIFKGEIRTTLEVTELATIPRSPQPGLEG